MTLIKGTACIIVIVMLLSAFSGCIPQSDNSKLSKKPELNKVYYISTTNPVFKGSYALAITLKSIQGIVNREKPQLFIVGDSFAYSEADAKWLDYYKQTIDADFIELKTIDELLTTFKDYFKGIITFNDSIKSYNGWISPLADTAAVIAGLTDTMPVFYTTADKYSQITGLKILESVEVVSGSKKNTITGDLNSLNFTNGLEIYHWQVDNLMEFANQHEYLALNWEGMDYAVQKKMLFIDLNIMSDVKCRELEDKVNQYFHNKNDLFDVWGWTEDEYIGVNRISEAGGFLRNIASGNLSFHAVVPSKIKQFKQKSNESLNNFKVDKDKFYITFMVSEADTAKSPISFNHGGYMEAGRGSVAINWGMPANTIVDFPAVAEYYQSTATENDYFYTSGGHYGGYVNLNALPEVSLNKMIEEGKRFTQLSDQPYLDYFSTFVFGSTDTNFLADYAKRLGVKGLIGRHKNSATAIEDWNGVLAVDRYYSYPERTVAFDNAVEVKGGFADNAGTGNENYLLYDREYGYMALDADVTYNTGTGGITAVRGFISDDHRSYYELRIVDGFKVELVKVVDGKETVLHSQRKVIKINVDYNLRLYLDGKTVTAAFGQAGHGKKEYLCKVEDSSLTKGKYGIYTSNQAKMKLKCVPLEAWREVYNNIVRETVDSGKSGGVCCGFYGLIVQDYETSQFDVETIHDEWMLITPSQLKKVMDELEKNYPGRFEDVTLDRFMKAAAEFK